jgi:SSS family solute:Na+ symporter
MNESLNTFDYSVIIFYLLGLMAIGWVLKNRASASLEQYIVAGRELPWWALGFSGVASMLDMAGTAIIIAFLFLLGPRGLFIEFRGGACLILAFMMLWMGKWHRRSGCLTAADWMVFRFGNGFGGQFARLSSVLAAVLSTVGMLAMLVFGAGQFLAVFLPLSPNMCAIILLSIATVYAAVSGFYGVVITDLFQGIFILLATVYVVFTAFAVAPDMESLATIAEQVTGNDAWTSSKLSWFTKMPEEFAAYQYLALFASLYLLRQVAGGMAAGDDPKYFGARNDRECGTLTFLWTSLMTVRWPLMMGLAILGLTLMADLFPSSDAQQAAVENIQATYPDVAPRGWDSLVSDIANNPQGHPPELISSLEQDLGAERLEQKVKLLAFSGGTNAEKVLPAVLLMSIKPGVRGLLIVALISAFMSTFDSHLNRAVGMVVHDFYRPYIRPSAQNSELILTSRVASVGLVVLSVLFALTFDSINDIWSWIIMGLTAGLLGPSILRFYWWRFTGVGFAIGTLTGLLAAVVQRLFAPEMHEFLVFLLVMGAGTTGSVFSSLLSEPIDDQILWNFYERTRPFGFWKPLLNRLDKKQRKQTIAEHKYDLLSVPFALLWQISMFMLSMLVLLHSWNAAAIWLGLMIVGLWGLYFFWYCKLPATNWYESTSEKDYSSANFSRAEAIPTSESSDPSSSKFSN